jgi:hypothetical protein
MTKIPKRGEAMDKKVLKGLVMVMMMISIRLVQFVVQANNLSFSNLFPHLPFPLYDSKSRMRNKTPLVEGFRHDLRLKCIKKCKKEIDYYEHHRDLKPSELVNYLECMEKYCMDNS